jgi:site-specific recombinase XerD
MAPSSQNVEPPQNPGRFSFASFLVNAGRSLYEVQELLGHADIRTTSRYAHLSRDRLFEAVEAVPNL